MAAGYDGSIRIDTRINANGFNAGTRRINSGLSRITSSLKGVAVAAGLVFGVKALIDFGKESLRVATEMQNALMGLQSIIQGQGRSFKEAKGFINEYISDGLVPATNAITAYKNLALRGYDDSQIKQVMLALKDSAAFGRQASYTLGQAVESATEGLKNENSILVDNAGVTKNVAKMWDEYAKSIGTTAKNLTQTQKVQAEVAGIMEETKYQMGDAAKIADSYSGRVLQLQFAFSNLKNAVGNAIQPIVSAVLPSIKKLVEWLTILANKVAQISAILFGKVVNVNSKTAESASSAANATAGLADATTDAGNAAETAGKQAKNALASFDELNVLAKDSGSGSSAVASPDAGVGSGTSVAIEDVEVEGISPELLASIERLKELLEPTIEALKRLWEQLKIIGGFAWEGLKDFYNTFLKPVGDWVFSEDSGLAKFIDIITNGLAAVDWQKINDALHELWVALAPFVINIGEGLLWFLENVLVPLGVWAMNNIVPLAIEALAAAIGILNGVIEALKPVGLWLWESFLSPIASWTGGVIVFVLESLVGALERISEWVSNNGERVRTIVENIAKAFILWESIQFLNYVSYIGALTRTTGWTALLKALQHVVMLGLTPLITSLGSAVTVMKGLGVAVLSMIQKAFLMAAQIVKETAAWIASTAAKIANSAAQIGMNVATTAWNAIAIIGTTVTTAFGAAVAFLTSPIGLVVIAIAGLIAVVVLLATHWDEVKTKASEVWESITGVWGKASDWFDEKVLDPIKKSFKEKINAMIGFTESLANACVKAVNTIIKAFNSIKIEIPDWVPGIGGKKFGINIPMVSEVKIPRLATGAVIPPNQEFMAILGDQKGGRNLEAPEGLIRQIIREEMVGFGGGETHVTVEFTGNLSQLARVLTPVIKKEERRTGGTLQTGGAF